MNKQLLRLWILQKIEKLAATASELESRIDHALYLTSQESQDMHTRCNQLAGKKQVLQELYDDFNLDEVSKEEIYYH